FPLKQLRHPFILKTKAPGFEAQEPVSVGEVSATILHSSWFPIQWPRECVQDASLSLGLRWGKCNPYRITGRWGYARPVRGSCETYERAADMKSKIMLLPAPDKACRY